MNLAETIYQKSLDLPEDKAIEVIDFIDFLKNRARPAEPVKQTHSIYQAFEEAGLIGCIETDEQLATTYKEKLNFSIKHGTAP
jgi:hypothetical protein